MKRLYRDLFLWAGLLILLISSACAQEADTLLEGALTDRLSFEDEVKWYRFEMAEPGDAVISAVSLQEVWDGCAYHWRCSVYADDLETVITHKDIPGFTEYYGQTMISLPELDPGTYYVQMKKPMNNRFVSDPYRLNLLRYYDSAAPVYDGSGVQVFRNAGDILWAFDGTAFLKLNDGECFAALTESRKGDVVPILIATEPAAVEYVLSNTGEKIKAIGPWHHYGTDTDYYYSNCQFLDYTDSSVDTASLPITFLDGVDLEIKASQVLYHWLSQTAEPRPEEPDEPESWLTLVKKHGWIMIVVVVLVLCGIGGSQSASKSKPNRYPVYRSGGSYGGSDWDSDYDPSPYGSIEERHQVYDDVDAGLRASQITETYGEDWGDYDPEAPTDSGDIY